MFTRATALLSATALVAIPASLLVASPAHADVTKSGACGEGRYELSVDRERGGWEVDADLDNVTPGSKWKIVLKHDGKTYFSGVRTADYEGDLDVDRYRKNTAGKDKFVFKATRVGGSSTTCKTAVTVG